MTPRARLSGLAADINTRFLRSSVAQHVQLFAGARRCERDALAQPGAARAIPAVAGLPAGAHDCGINFAVDLAEVVQGSNNTYAIGNGALACEPTASAGGASESADTLTLRHASLVTTAARAGRMQLYSSARAAHAPLLLFADGRAPGPIDDEHEVRDLEVRTWYVANNSVDRPAWPALRVKSLTETRGAAQFRDEEIMPGVEDLQVQFIVAYEVDGEQRVRFLAPDNVRNPGDRVIAVRCGCAFARTYEVRLSGYTPISTRIRIPTHMAKRHVVSDAGHGRLAQMGSGSNARQSGAACSWSHRTHLILPSH